jgi:hypothetical protein
VKAYSKENAEYEYFGVLKIKIPRGFTVNAEMVKLEIEHQMENVIQLLAFAYRIYQPAFEHDLLSSLSITTKIGDQVD